MVSFEMVHLVNFKSLGDGGWAKWIWNGPQIQILTEDAADSSGS